MPHGLKTSSTATCRSERRPRWPSCKGKKPHDQASADQVQEAVTLRSVAAFPFWSIFVDEFRASLRLFWRQHACALRPCQSRADLIRQQFGANVGIGSCVPPQPSQKTPRCQKPGAFFIARRQAPARAGRGGTVHDPRVAPASARRAEIGRFVVLRRRTSSAIIGAAGIASAVGVATIRGVRATDRTRACPPPARRRRPQPPTPGGWASCSPARAT